MWFLVQNKKNHIHCARHNLDLLWHKQISLQSLLYFSLTFTLIVTYL